tara:strand:- start:751 stop:2496 length:1746 start_codon:yes stop_codon:yes gene_type:complete
MGATGLMIMVLLLGATNCFAGKVLRYAEAGSPSTLDPVQSATRYSNVIVTAVYDTLYEYKYLKRPYELKPSLAVALPKVSKDGLTYTILIKKGIKFIDDPAFKDGKGRELVAEDFIYSIKRHFDVKNRSQGSWLWRGKIVGLDEWKDAGSDYNIPISGLKSVDSHTLEIRLKKAYPQIVYTLAMGFSAVVPHEAVAKYGQELSVHPVGTGPFKLQSFSTQKISLVRNPSYRKDLFDLKTEGYSESEHGFTGIKALAGKKLPIVDRVEVSFIKQDTARWNSFTKGSEIQYTSIPSEAVDSALASKSPITLNKKMADLYHLFPELEGGMVYSGFNMADSTFGYHKDPVRNKRNRDLRCAIRKAFNWPQRINRFYFGLGQPYAGVIPPFVEGYSDLGADSVTFDPRGAKNLLKNAGWTQKNLPILEYSGVSSVKQKQFFEQFRGFLKGIGYPRSKLKLKQFATFGDYNRAIKNRSLTFISLGWGLDYPDSENMLQLFYGPNGSPGSNSTNYSNPEFDALYEQAAVMGPGIERTKLFEKMSRILVDDCVVISGFSRTKLLVWHKNAVMFPSVTIVGNIFKYVDVK